MIILYRRHSQNCPTQDPARPESKLSYRAKRLYMACDCPIWVSGNIDGRTVERQSCGTRDLATAKRMVAAFGDVEPVIDRGPTLAECITKYIDRREHDISDGTRFYYKMILGWLREFAEKNGIAFIRDLTVEFLERFKFEGLPQLRNSTRSTYVAKVCAFVREAERLGWIETPVVHRVRPHQYEHEQTMPFTEDEVIKLLDASGTYRPLVELMLETGLRVSDAIRFDPSRLTKGDHLWIYPFQMRKRKRLAKPRAFEVFVTDRLKVAIETMEWASEKFPFSSPAMRRGDYTRIYREMQRIGAECGIQDCRPHRLRDTFAIRRLLAGISLDDVSRLLGHSSVTMTEKAYSPWVPARTRRLEGIVAASLEPPLVHAQGNGRGDAH